MFSVVPITPIMTPSLGGFLTPINAPTMSSGVTEVSASYIPTKTFELLNKISGKGLKVDFRFTRSQHLVSSAMTSIEMTFTNESGDEIKDIRVGSKVRREFATQFVSSDRNC